MIYLSRKGAIKVGRDGSNFNIFNKNVEYSGLRPSSQDSDYVKAKQKAQLEGLNNRQYRAKLSGPKMAAVRGGAWILSKNIESSGWALLHYKENTSRPSKQEKENNYMIRVGKNTKTTKVGGGG